MNDRVLILGGSSPLGRAAAAHIEAAGLHSVSVSRSTGHMRADVRDARSMDALISSERPRALVYLVSPKPAELEDPGLAREMTTALAYVIDRAQAAGVEAFVFASSAAVYGTAASTPRCEEDPLAGTNAYARFKIDSERLLASFTRGPMTRTSLRYFNLFGSGFRDSLINRLADPASAPPLRVSDSFVRDYVAAEDAGRAVVSALTRRPGAPYRVYNVGTGEGTSNLALAQLADPDAYTLADGGSPSFSVAAPDRARRELDLAVPNRVAAALYAPERFGMAYAVGQALRQEERESSVPASTVGADSGEPSPLEGS